MKPSEFLRYCAECTHTYRQIDRSDAPAGWTHYIYLTLPSQGEWDSNAIVETRVLRFLLAAAIAEGEGN